MPSYAPIRPSLLAAPVPGLAALMIIEWLPSRDEIRAKLRTAPAGARDEILTAVDALRAAADAWEKRNAASRAEADMEDEDSSPVLQIAGPALQGATVSAEEAAQMIGCTSRRVRQLLYAGRLSGEKRNRGCWAVHVSSVEGYTLTQKLAQAS